jgi:hypothetical protein
MKGTSMYRHIKLYDDILNGTFEISNMEALLC